LQLNHNAKLRETFQSYKHNPSSGELSKDGGASFWFRRVQSPKKTWKDHISGYGFSPVRRTQDMAIRNKYSKELEVIVASSVNPKSTLWTKLENVGFHAFPVHWYYPMPYTAALPDQLFDYESDLAGIEFQVASQLNFLKSSAPAFAEFSSAQFTITEVLSKQPLDLIDTAMLYGMIKAYSITRVFVFGDESPISEVSECHFFAPHCSAPKVHSSRRRSRVISFLCFRRYGQPSHGRQPRRFVPKIYAKGIL
jgi:hypothetical protein